MVKGFYNLTSGMLTQRRNLDVISSNMANVSTVGFKSDQLMSSTFQEEMMARTGNTDKSNPRQLASTSMVRIPRETVTDYTQGGFKETEKKLDLAISGGGFFKVQDGDQIRYTRSGSFNINNDGYICTQFGSLLLGENGPIRVFDPDAQESETKDGDPVELQLNVENITVNAAGGVFDCDDNYLDQISVVFFADETQLVKDGIYFTTNQQELPANSAILQGCLEQSNVDPLKEMVAMIESERHLQSAAQVLKMYDKMLEKATTEIGRIS